MDKPNFDLCLSWITQQIIFLLLSIVKLILLFRIQAFLTSIIIDDCSVETATREVEYLF